MQKFIIKTVNQLNEADIHELLKDPPVLFVGSYISVYAPTSLPSGGLFCFKMFEYIFGTDSRNPSWLYTEFKEIPFEALMELSPDEDKAREAIFNLYSRGVYNDLHEVVCKALLNNKISALITPNYDTTFDTFLQPHVDTLRIRVKEDYDKWEGHHSHTAFYKIHGSAEPNHKETLIFTLSQEGQLASWKQELLTNLITNKNVVFIGYSGRDFDICPYIANREINNYNKVYWLHYSTKEIINEDDDIKGLSGYANHLLNSGDQNVLLLGDMVKLLNVLFRDKKTVSEGDSLFCPANLFNFSEEEILQWRIKIIDRLGCVNAGWNILKLSENRLSAFFYEKTVSSFYAHSGRYRESIKQSMKTAQSVDEMTSDKINALIRAADVSIPYGNYCRAYKLLKTTENAVVNSFKEDNHLGAAVLRLKLTFWMRIWQLLRPKFIKRLILGRKVIKIYSEAKKELEPLGVWDDRQMLQHVAERLEIADGQNLSLPSNVGFINLGMPNMDIIKFRDRIRYGEKNEMTAALTLIDNYIEKADQFGIYTEVWKLSRLKIIKTKTLNTKEKLRCWAVWKKYLTKTQYIAPFKIIHLSELYVRWLIIILDDALFT